MNNETLKSIKIEIREETTPYFEDDEIEYYYNKNGGNVKETIYELLIIKSEASELSVSGLSTKDTSSYFRRLASRYRKYNSGVLS